MFLLGLIRPAIISKYDIWLAGQIRGHPLNSVWARQNTLRPKAVGLVNGIEVFDEESGYSEGQFKGERLVKNVEALATILDSF